MNAGTDQTQQTTATLRVDLVIGAGNSLTSAATPFTAAEVGNLIHLTSGVNFTPGFFELVSISGAVVTLDRSPGTLAASGGTGRVGGAHATINDQPAIVGGTVWMQGAFTSAAGWIPNAGVGDGQFVVYAGYTTTRGDNGLATLTATGVGGSFGQADQMILKNFVIDGAGFLTRGIDMGTDCAVENVWVRRCSLSGMRALNEGTRIRRSLFTECGTSDPDGGGLVIGTGVIVSECEARDNVSNGFVVANNQGDLLDCVARRNTGAGFYLVGDDGPRLRNCTSDGNTLDGLRLAGSNACAAIQVVGSLFSNNAGKGVNSVTTDYTTAARAAVATFFRNNAFYNNTGGNYGQLPAGTGDVLLTADPYTAAASGDFSLNGVTGGGAAALGAGLPGGIGLLGTGTLASTGHRDIGAVQTLGAQSTGSAVATMRSLWRELTNERFSTLADSVVDVYLTWALHELNRRVHYHVSDGTITLVAGTQEYSLPSDFVEAQWLQYSNFRKLERGDVERWMARGEDWRHEAAGEPLYYAIYANKLVVRPVPSSEAVTAAAGMTLRYVSTPPSITTAGPEQLGSQEYRTVVVWAAYLWSAAYPDSAVAQQRGQALKAEFEDQAKLIQLDYAHRSISS